MEIVVVSDTNILIDLIDVGLLEQFFKLPFEFHTTDIVVAEVKDEQQRATVNEFIRKGVLRVKSFNPDEMVAFGNFVRTKNRGNKLHAADLSVWAYASINKYVLLTGDGRLRKMASEDGVTVHGTIYVFDLLVKLNIMSPDMAAMKIEILKTINSRLPENEIKKRIEIWRRDKKGKEDLC